MTKSMPPSSLTHLFTADSRLELSRTSTAPNPRTFAPGLAPAISAATRVTFSVFLPTIHAFAPRMTRARTCALQMSPEPPVQNTTLFSTMPRQQFFALEVLGCGSYRRFRLSRHCLDV